jgi:hypothetical protein
MNFRLATLCRPAIHFIPAPPPKKDELAKSLGMAKLKVRYTRSSGVAKAEAYMWYAEHFATRYDAVDRTFCDAIKKEGDR